MTGGWHRCSRSLMMVAACGLSAAVGVASSSAGAAPERNMDTIAGRARGAPPLVSSGGVGLSIPRPTGRHPVGIRSTFVFDPARTEPKTGGPRAIPAWVWYPAERRRGPVARYLSAPVQSVIEQAFGL